MQDAGERAYAYAKACGIIGKSFVGKRLSALAGPRSLNELDRLVFPEVYRELPGRELLVDIENRILARAVRQILAVIDSYAEPPELLVRQLRAYEYADLKTCLHHLAGGIQTPPAFSDIGRFRTVRFEAYPDLRAMLAGTEFECILSKDLSAIQAADFELAPLEAELDARYYTALTQSVRRLSGSDRQTAGRILSEEISLRNCVWALRLRTYFKKTPGETAKHLMNLTISAGEIAPGGDVSLAAEAFESLELPLDSRAAWRGWRWERFLNPETPGESWAADPRCFQNAASEYLYTLSLRCFRREPFSISSVFCYIKLKQFEEDILTSIAEGLGLGMGGKDVFDLLGGKL